jgi:hypothetical protein
MAADCDPAKGLVQIGISRNGDKMELKRAYAVKEFCEAYDLCRDKVYGEIRAGRLRAVKAGGRTLVLKSDAEAWAASLPSLELK